MTAGGDPSRARGASHDTSRAAGWIPYAFCSDHIRPDEYDEAYYWFDPNGETVIAHGACLIALGERDLELR